MTHKSPIHKGDIYLEVGKNRVLRQRTLDEVLDFASVGAESISRVDTKLLTHGTDHTPHLGGNMTLYGTLLKWLDLCYDF